MKIMFSTLCLELRASRKGTVASNFMDFPEFNVNKNMCECEIWNYVYSNPHLRLKPAIFAGELGDGRTFPHAF